MTEHTDPQLISWVIRLYSAWIERSPLTYAEARRIILKALVEARKTSHDTKHLRRAAAIALIDALQEAGPPTDWSAL